MKCKCGQELLECDGIGYIHPHNDESYNCQEDDGVIIEQDIRQTWNNKHPYQKTHREQFIALQKQRDEFKNQLIDSEKEVGMLVKEKAQAQTAFDIILAMYERTINYKVKELWDNLKRTLSRLLRKK